MSLEPGTRLGQYEIVGPIGAGGMGEVYRARDPKLQRDVAIKVLPAARVVDPDRRARLLREARACAAANHPSIAAVHEVGEAGGLAFIAMELVEGETLRSLIRRGPLPIRRSLELAAELAEGLAFAHRQRIIHRDFKPDNVIVRSDGHAKILDFGLAKLQEPGESERGSPISEIETLAGPMTRGKVIMGTPAYMSPEQARGETLDARSDIFSFGITLYEMAVGKPPFEGRSAMDVQGAILRDEPARVSEANPLVPPELDRIIRKCLEKAPEDRYQHADDMVVDLRRLRRDGESGFAGISASSGAVAVSRDDRAPSGGRWSGARLRGLLALVALGILAGSGISWWVLRMRAPWSSGAPPQVLSFEIDIGKALTLYDWSIVAEFALSPDGTRLAYVARTGKSSMLFLRRLDEIKAVAVAGTEHALAPFFSPDGRWVAYYSSDPSGQVNQLKKVPVDGGPPQTLCDAWPPSGGTWLPDGTILFSSTEPVTGRPAWDGSIRWGLFRVGENGGTPSLIASVDRTAGGEAAYSSPRFLPGGRAALFTIRRTAGAWALPGQAAVQPDWSTTKADIALLDLATGTHRVLIENAHNASYAGSGHVLFMRGKDLWAAPFDLNRLAVAGPERIVRENLQAMDYPTMNAPYAIDAEGSAVFLPAAEVPARGRALVWVDRSGRNERSTVPAASGIETPRVSPDGERILYVVQEATGDIWVHERSRPGSRIRLTFDGTDDRRPVWFPDSRRFLYMERTIAEASPVGFVTRIFLHRADGAGKPAPWPRQSPDLMLSLPMVILADRQTVLYQEGGSPGTLWDIADSSRSRSDRYIVQSQSLEEDPVLSSDGRWLAYSALESGIRQIYVRPYPDTHSARWQVTTEGGNQPLWAPDGSELYYRTDPAMMAIAIRTRPSFRADPPVKLFEGDFTNQDHARRDYDLDYPGGKRFLMIEEIKPDVPDTRLVYVRNWSETLTRLLSPGDR